jgi:DNA end-binding protein Ku
LSREDAVCWDLTLRYPYEVRDEQPYFEDIPDLKLLKEMLDLATHIVQTKAGHFDPAQFEDRYENALIDILKKKEAGEKIEPAKEGPTPQVVNLMDALRASIDAEKKKALPPARKHGDLLRSGPVRSDPA